MFMFSELHLMLHHGFVSLMTGVNEDPRENVAFLIPQEDRADSFITRWCWWLYSVVYLSSFIKLMILLT